jgi:hypothetical protein
LARVPRGVEWMVAKREESAIARHLVVAHQTAASPELIQRARNLEAQDPEAQFLFGYAGILLSRLPHGLSRMAAGRPCPASYVAATGYLSST